MTKYLRIIIAFFIISSCAKKTECKGTAYSLNGLPTSGLDIYLIERHSTQGFKKSKVATTNTEGYYQFSFKAKRINYVYSMTCDNFGSTPLKKGEINNVDIHLTK